MVFIEFTSSDNFETGGGGRIGKKFYFVGSDLESVLASTEGGRWYEGLHMYAVFHSHREIREEEAREIWRRNLRRLEEAVTEVRGGRVRSRIIGSD